MPIYETSLDKGREAEVAKYLSKKWDCHMHKLPEMHPVDWTCVRGGRVKAFVEIKVRPDYTREAIDHLGGYMIDIRKIAWLRLLSEESGVDALLCVRLADELYYWKFDKAKKLDVVMGGRADRPDGIEACSLIPMYLFSTITRQFQSEASLETFRPATSRSGSSRHPIEF